MIKGVDPKLGNAVARAMRAQHKWDPDQLEIPTPLTRAQIQEAVDRMTQEERDLMAALPMRERRLLLDAFVLFDARLVPEGEPVGAGSASGGEDAQRSESPSACPVCSGTGHVDGQPCPFCTALPPYVFLPTEAEISEARDRLQRFDRINPNGMTNTAAPETRMEGHVAEAVFSRWLQERRVSHEWDGGPNPQPDFTIAGVAVGVRITARKQPGSFPPHHNVYVFARHVRGAPERFFIGVNRVSGEYTLLGGIAMKAFMQAATLLRPGEELCRGFVAQHEMHVAYIRDLEQPDAWLDRILG